MKERPIMLEQFVASNPALGDLAIAIYRIFVEAELRDWDPTTINHSLDKVLVSRELWQIFTTEHNNLGFGSPTFLAFLRALAHSQMKNNITNISNDSFV